MRRTPFGRFVDFETGAPAAADHGAASFSDYDGVATDAEDEYNRLLLWRLSGLRELDAGAGAGGTPDALLRVAEHLTTANFSLKLLPIAEMLSFRQYQAASDTVPRPSADSTLHVHFGAGRLALGLVLPALVSSGRPFAVVQRPSEDFAAMRAVGGGRGVEVRVRDAAVAELTLITDENDLLGVGPDSRLLVLSEDPMLLQALVARASTLSCALGPALVGVLEPLLDVVMDRRDREDLETSAAWAAVARELPAAPEGVRPVLYCCENDHSAAQYLEERFIDHMDVVACMVDRICTDRSVTADALTTSAEPYGGSLVVLSPPFWAPLPAFAGPAVTIPQAPATAQYVCRRKLLTVNGMHTTLAFMTLQEREAGPGILGDYPLLTPGVATAEQQRSIWAWAVARGCLLLFEHDVEVMMNAHAVVCLAVASSPGTNRDNVLPGPSGQPPKRACPRFRTPVNCT